MSGGAPIPVSVSDSEAKILCIADLEKAASKKLPTGARGQCIHMLVVFRSLVTVIERKKEDVFHDDEPLFTS